MMKSKHLILALFGMLETSALASIETLQSHKSLDFQTKM